MRILVISDTHGNFPLALKACHLAEPFSALIHLGDSSDDAVLLKDVLEVEVISVAGNCDFDSFASRERLIECGGKKLLLLHGDVFRVKSGLGLLEKRVVEVGADAVLYGHTHRAKITTLSGVLTVNPGTLLHTAVQKSYAVLEITFSGISARLYEIN